jgi:hypothetical protein
MMYNDPRAMKSLITRVATKQTYYNYVWLRRKSIRQGPHVALVSAQLHDDFEKGN